MMKGGFPVVLAAGLLCPVLGRVMQRRMLSEAEGKEFGARSLDGSPYAFYMSEHESDAIPRDWIVYLNGGGECYTLKDCKDRATGFTYGMGGTTSDSPAHMDDDHLGGAFNLPSSNATANPHFASFGKIWLPYLTGDDWLGTQREKCDPWRGGGQVGNRCGKGLRPSAYPEGRARGLRGASPANATMVAEFWAATADGKCERDPAALFPFPIDGVQCTGLHAAAGRDAKECARSCCRHNNQTNASHPPCTAWQFGYGSCWIGAASGGTCTTPDPNWVGGSADAVPVPTTPAPTPFAHKELHFSGHNNFVAALNLSLFRVMATVPVRSVLLAGFSAGGQGSFYHADFFADAVHAVSPKTIVKVNPGWGWYAPPTDRYKEWRQGKTTDPGIPYPSSKNPTGVPQWIAAIDHFLPSRCVESLAPYEDPLVCGSSQRVAMTIQAPLFISTDIFDGWLTGVEEECCGEFWPKKGNKNGIVKVGPTDLDSRVRYLMTVTAPAVRSSIVDATNSSHGDWNTTRGAYVPACLDHNMGWEKWPTLRPVGAVDNQTGCNHAEAVASWFFGPAKKDFNGHPVKPCPRVLVDYTDTVEGLRKYPCNKGKIRKNKRL